MAASAWKITVLGVRGSLPVPDRQFLEYGGNTSCIAVEHGGGLLCLDAGSGLSGLDRLLEERKRLDLLISHVHLDHIIGLLGLHALFRPGLEVHLYGEARDGVSFRRRLDSFAGRPYWPVCVSEFSSRPQFHELRPGDRLHLCGIEISTLRGNHPGDSLLYRLDGQGRSLTYALDCEMDKETFSALEDFARGTDLLIWDAAYTAADRRPGWGHSTWEEGLAAGRAAGAKRVLMTHYCREYNDQFLREQELAAQKADGSCIFAREGMVIEL